MTEPVDIDIAREPFALAVGDVDGDRLNDVVVMRSSEASILELVPLFGDGEGGFTAGTTTDLGTLIGPELSYAVHLARFDDDDVLDALVNMDRQKVLAGAGDGTFAEELQTVDAGGPNLTSSLTADVDDDGDVDILLASDGGQGVTRWRNDGTGVFTAEYLLNFTEPQALALADIDRDTYFDVVAADVTATYLLRGDADGNLVAEPGVFDPLDVSWDFTFRSLAGLYALDLDGDEHVDLVFGSEVDGVGRLDVVLVNANER